jgi:hypothetical protein
MKKKSYISKKEKKLKKIKNMPVINSISEEETGARGYIFPATYRGQPFMKNEEGEGSITVKLENYKRKKTPYKDLKDIMILLSDDLDQKGEIALANFGDFLIKKIAEVEIVDYIYQFNLLIKSINNSDFLDKDKKISDLVLKFNSFIQDNTKTLGEVSAKMQAYQLAREEVENYVR